MSYLCQGLGICEIEINAINGYPGISNKDICVASVADNDVKAGNHKKFFPRIRFQTIKKFPVIQQFDFDTIFPVMENDIKADE